jgi:hypothetical protein
LIISPTGRFYVGQTRSLKHRIYTYQYKIKDPKRLVTNSIMKYGWDAHYIDILEEVEDISLLDEREMFWIKELKSHVDEGIGGMNMSYGGGGNSFKWRHDDKRKAHMSKMFKDRNHTVPKWAAVKGKEMMEKAVLLYDSNGDFVREYESATDAAKDLNVGRAAIQYAARNGTWQDCKYLFRYKDDGKVDKMPIPIMKFTGIKPVLCFVGSYIIKYNSPKDAAKDLKMSAASVRRYANGIDKTVLGGYKFLYEEIFNKQNTPCIVGDASKSAVLNAT